MIITLNSDQRLFVFNHGKYIDCLGFDVCEKRKNALANEIDEPLNQTQIGAIEAYNEYERIVDIARQKHAKTGWRSKSELIPEFIGREGERVEVIDNYGDQRRFYIGKSTGFIPNHLEILKKNSTGGVSVMGYPFRKITFLGKSL